MLAEMFNSHYINIVENTSGKKPSHFPRDNKISDTTQTMHINVQQYLDHSNINRIKITSKIRSPLLNFLKNFGANAEKICKILSVIYTQKTVGFGMIPPKLFKMAESVLFQPLSNEINNSLSKDNFLDDAKIALVSPLDKGTSK